MSTLNNNPDTNITTVVISQTDYISASRVDINNNFGKLNSYASYVSAGLVILATASDVTSGNTKNVVTSDLLKSNVDIINSEILELSAAISGNVQTYTNLSAVPTTIGGITAGSTFNSVPITTMFDLLLYPYQTPSFSSFAFSNFSSTTIEVGTSIGASYNVTWGTSNSSNVSANSVNITDVTGGNVSMASGLANDGSETVSYSTVTKNSVASHTFRISATNTQSSILTRDLTYSWLFRVYSGNSSLTSLAESDIEALSTSSLKSSYSGNYGYVAASGTYKYLCFPSSYGTPTSFKDSSTNLDVPMTNLGAVSVTNTNGVTVNYNVWRSVNQLGGAITIIVA